MARRNRTPDGQLEMELFPVSVPPSERRGELDVDTELRECLSLALKHCPLSREQVAARMAELLAYPTLSAHMLNAYAAPAKGTHKFPLQFLPAFIVATGAYWLADRVAQWCGGTFLMGEEARAAELGMLERQRQELNERIRDLKRTVPLAKVDRGQGR